ncbi:MAG: T9SS type A sorting domain-containing protein [Saprospiraceae bacterium]
MKNFYKLLFALVFLLKLSNADAQYSTGISVSNDLYSFIAIEGSFGTRLHYDNLTVGDLTVVKDINGSTFACDTITQDLSGKIVIIDRGGTCNSFVRSCLNVAKKGAVAVIVANADGAGFGIMGGGTNPLAAQIKIPCVMIQKEDADSLKAQIKAAGLTPVVCGLSHPNNYSNDAYEIQPGKYLKAIIEQHIFAGLASIFPEYGAVDSINAKQSAFFLYVPSKSGTITVSSCDGLGDTNLHIYECNRRYADLKTEPNSANWYNEGECAKDKDDINLLAARLTAVPVTAGKYYYIEFDDRNSPDSFYFDLAFAKNDSVDVTFNVDMYAVGTIDPAGVHIAGNFQGWDPAKTKMDNIPGTSIYSKTITVASDQTLEYKFVNGDAWGKDESVPNSASCSAGKDGNRKLLVATDDIVLNNPCFNSCEKCLIPKPDLVCSPDAVICDPFKNYPLGSIPLGPIPHWSTWNDSPSAGTAYVSTEEFSSDTKAMRVDGNLIPFQDIIFKTGNHKAGHYKIKFNIFVPTITVGANKRQHAYYSFQHDLTGNHVFGSEIYFFSNGLVSCYLGATELGTGSYTPNQWVSIVHDIDIDKDTIFSDIGGFQLGWKWSRARTTVPTTNKQLAGLNFYVDSTYTKYFIDDIQFIQILDPTAKTKVTFSVDMANETVDPVKGVCVAGNFQKAAGYADDWKPGITKLINKTGTSLWELTLDIPIGNYDYKFINDDAWNNKEEKMTGKACANGDNRKFSVTNGTAFKVGTFCYNECSICVIPAVTFTVDLSKEKSVSKDGVSIAGNFQQAAGKGNNWTPGVIFLTQVSGKLYRTTLNIPTGIYEYKFLNGNAWGTDEAVPNTASCAAGKDGNRKLVVGKTDIKLDTVCFNYCVSCDKAVGSYDPDFDQALRIFPNPATEVLNLNYRFESTITLHARLLNLLGQVVYQVEIPQINSGTAQIDIKNLPAGTYLLELTDDLHHQTTKKLVIE